MDYSRLVRKARARNIRITKNTRGGRRYLTATELRKKLKRKSRSKKITVVKRGFFGGLLGGIFGRSVRKTKVIRRKGRKGRSKKICICNRRKCKCKSKGRRNLKLRRSGGGVRAGALFALKTIATGAAIQLGSEAAKRALAGQM